MLWLYGLDHRRLKPLVRINEGEIESVLETGDKTMSLDLPVLYADCIQEEFYIRTKTDEYVIKKVDKLNTSISVEAKLNTEALEATLIDAQVFKGTISDIVNKLLSNTDYELSECDITGEVEYELQSKSTVLDTLIGLFSEFSVEPTYDTFRKKIALNTQKGVNRGVFFMDRLNLRELKVQTDSYELRTRVFPAGKDGLKIAEVNGGVEYLDNFTFCNKILSFEYKDEQCDDPQKLKIDALKKLDEVSKPFRSYEATVVDLAKLNQKYSRYEIGLGDTITLVSKSTNVKDKQRVSVYKENLVTPSDNTVELCNRKLKLEDILKERNSI